jgi:hypothetical protein
VAPSAQRFRRCGVRYSTITRPSTRLNFLHHRCGNGLLVHILISLGYDGVGFDLRSRKSWAHYSVETQQHLRVLALDPTEPLDDTIFKGDQFLIGNHADEMQPWLPVIAVVTNSKFLSMPCCAWDFDTRFQRKKKTSKEKEQETALASKLRMEDGIKKSTYGGSCTVFCPTYIKLTVAYKLI